MAVNKDNLTASCVSVPGNLTLKEDRDNWTEDMLQSGQR